jgi:hypothetical protein
MRDGKMTYRAELTESNGRVQRMGWQGKANEAQAARMLLSMNRSLLPGGCNNHLVEAGCTGYKAIRVFHQASGSLMVDGRMDVTGQVVFARMAEAR